MNTDQILREQMIEVLNGKGAHMSFEEAIKGFPLDKINEFPHNVSYTFWHLVEHIRIAQSDILEYIKETNYKEIKWPDEYWPAKDKKATVSEWNKTIEAYRKNLAELRKIISDSHMDLFKPVYQGKGVTLFREIMLVIDHNAYHVGEFAILRQVAKTW